MLSDLRVIAIVPARGGDDEVPYLNIKKLGPMPLIAYTLSECQKSRYIDRIIVSTDDDEVARIAESHGAQAPFRRPDSLTRDIPLIKPIIEHAVRTIETEEGIGYDLVVTLQATSPFRTHDQIDRALERLNEDELDSVISVREVRALSWRQRGESLEPLFDKAGRRENLEPVFHEDGAIWAMRRSVLEDASRLGERVGHIPMDKMSSLTIHDIYDFWLAERLVRLPRVLFRVDGGGDMGMGHVFRSLAVAMALRSVSNADVCFLMDPQFAEGTQQVADAGFTVRLLATGGRADTGAIVEAIQDYSPNIIINDQPFLDSGYLSALARLGASTINLVDSLADIEDPAAIASVIVATIQDEEVELTNYYAGPAFAILRDNFRDKASKRLNRDASRNSLQVILSFGGSDPQGITLKALEAMEIVSEAASEKDGLVIDTIVVLGPAFSYEAELSALVERLAIEPHILRRVEHMADLLVEADLVVCSGGMTVFEIAALGRPGVVLCQNAKETTRMERFAVHGSVRQLGLGTQVSTTELAREIRELVRSPAARQVMTEAGLQLVDAKGAGRVAEVLMQAERRGPAARGKRI